MALHLQPGGSSLELAVGTSFGTLLLWLCRTHKSGKTLLEPAMATPLCTFGTARRRLVRSSALPPARFEYSSTPLPPTRPPARATEFCALAYPPATYRSGDPTTLRTECLARNTRVLRRRMGGAAGGVWQARA